MTEMKESSRLLKFKKYKELSRSFKFTGPIQSPLGSGNIAGTARNKKRRSVINYSLNCQSKLSYNSNSM